MHIINLLKRIKLKYLNHCKQVNEGVMITNQPTNLISDFASHPIKRRSTLPSLAYKFIKPH